MMAKIGVLGLARSGRSAAALALARGLELYASDLAESAGLREVAAEIEARGGTVELGRHTLAELASCSEIVVSPGIPPTAPVLSAPELEGIPQISEIEFASRYLDTPLIAVTGTNGKTTTTALIAHLLEASGFDTLAAGNIGLPLSEVVLLEDLPSPIVVEVSSFQLAGIVDFAPEIRVLTNLALDHLDRYETKAEYYADKARLFENATPETTWILNADDEDVLELSAEVPGRRLYFTTRRALTGTELGAFVSADGELMVYLEGEAIGLVRSVELQLLGRHNLENALAASLAALAAGATPEGVREGLKSFEPLPDRLEPVAEIDGVLWINDSKATNISSTRVAVEGLDRPLILLLGGRHKGESYEALLPSLEGRVRRVIAYGEAGPLIEEELGGALEVERIAGGFDRVIYRAAELARPGEAVLLAPACSSYDLFADYEERGARFRELVGQLRGGGDGG